MHTQAAAPAREPMAFVTDLRATRGPREHELFDGAELKRHRFLPGQRLELPMRVAEVLIGNDGFKVEDETGVTLRQVAREIAGQRVNLRSDQTVARYDELTREALRARVEEAGGDPAKIGRTREDMSGWLVRQGATERTIDDAPEADDLLEPDDDAYA